MTQIWATIRRELARLEMRIGNLWRRGEVTLAADDHTVQVSGFEDEQYDEVELIQQYGLASRPPIGGEILVAHLNGKSEDAIAFATTSRADRPTDLAAGEVVVYGHKGTGQPIIRLAPDGGVSIAAGTGKTVDVGGSTDSALRGTTFVAAFSGMASATDPATTMALVNAILAALKAAPLSTKTKVG